MLNHKLDADFSGSKKYIRKIAENILEHGLPKGTLINVNIPDLPETKIKGVKVCRQAMAKWEEEFDERLDPNKRKYYWLTGKFVNFEPEAKDTDEWALQNGFVSVVPVMHDLTAHNYINHLKNTL